MSFKVTLNGIPVPPSNKLYDLNLKTSSILELLGSVVKLKECDGYANVNFDGGANKQSWLPIFVSGSTTTFLSSTKVRLAV